MAIPVSIYTNGSYADYEVVLENDTCVARRLQCGILDSYRYPETILLHRINGAWKSDTFNAELTERIGKAVEQYENMNALPGK